MSSCKTILCHSDLKALEYILKQRSSVKGLAEQILRALNSIVLNIAEGSADTSDIEFSRFLGISVRSVYETVAGFDLAEVYGMVTTDLNSDAEKRAEKLVKQLSAFRSSLTPTSRHKL